MSLFSTIASWRRIFGGPNRKLPSGDDRFRLCRFEQMEPRQLLSAAPPQIHFGSVFFDSAPGANTTPHTIQVTFQGGVAGTQLTQLIIDGSKNQLGLAVGDVVWQGPGSPAQGSQSPLTVVSHNGFNVVNQTAINGGTQIVFTLSGFDPGEKLVLTDNAEKVTAIDPVTGAATLAPLTKGNDFQSAHLVGTFIAPHYENLGVNTGYVAGFDVLFNQNNTTFGAPLDLPNQSYMPPGETDQSNQTTGANVLVTQTPLPISIGGTVFSDPNLNNHRDAGEVGLGGVSVTLMELSGGSYVTTGKTMSTDAGGGYLFQFLQPGTYEVVESKPAGYFAVGASAGTVLGVTDGSVASKTVVNQIAVDGGEDSVHNDFALAQAGSLSGYVYHDTNNNGVRETGEMGLGGVTVVVTPISTIDGSTTPLQTVTAADGSYSVTGLAPGQYTVTEPQQPAGYLDGKVAAGSLGGTVAAVGDQITGVSILGGQAGVEYDFGKRLPGNIAGNVSDCLAGTPLAGVTVQLLDANGNVIKSTSTNEAGNYQFTSLSPGAVYGVKEILPTGYILNDEAVGTAGGSIAADAAIVQIALTDGVSGTGYNFCDVKPAAIGGNVSDCLANQALAGVTVQLLDANGAVIGTTTTDAQGNYQFNNLAPGKTYGVSEILPTGYVHNDENVGSAGGAIVDHAITQVALGDGVSGVGYNFCDVLPASVSGNVSDCVANLPLSGVTVQLLDANGAILKTTTTDAQGNYKFAGLQPGATYGVDEIVPSGYAFHDEEAGSAGGSITTAASILQIALGDGVQAVGYDFCDVKPAGISGNVSDCLAGTPLAGVTVRLTDASGNLLKTTTTDEAGNYSFSGLTPGEQYGVSEILPAGYMHNDENLGASGGAIVNDAFINIPLGDGVSAVGYNFCDVLPASLGGSVADCSLDKALSGVTVQLLDANGNVVSSTTTGESGNYQFAGLKPGQTYGVREILPAGYLHDHETAGTSGGQIAADASIVHVTLDDGAQATGYDFCDEMPVTISGFVKVDKTGNPSTNPNATPLSGVTVNLLDSEGNILSTTTTDANGHYVFAGGMLPGTYGVQAITPGGYFAEEADAGSLGGSTVGADTIETVTLLSGQNGVNYNFFIDPPGTISGFVFQDGPEIVLPQGATLTPAQVAQYRTGQFVTGDKRLGGIMLYLGNADGQLMLDNNLQPISAVTDANGFYQFTGLQAGTYTVLNQSALDQQPNTVKGLDTPGTTGGIALNPNTVIDPAIVHNLAIPLTSNAIIQIPLAIGGQSELNNFSVVVTTSEPPISPPQPPIPPFIPPAPPQFPIGSIEFFAPPASPVQFAPPYNPLTFTLFMVGGFDEPNLSWHLSVVDGGQPRESQDEPRAAFTPAGFNINSWSGIDLGKAQWTINNGAAAGDPKLKYVFGTPGAIPVQGDFAGDGKTRMGVFIDGEWFIDMNGNGVWDEGDMYCKLGNAGDKPVVGDWDGDGKDDIGVFGPAWSNDATAVAREPGLPKPHNAPTGAKKNHPPQSREASGHREMKVTSRGKIREDVIDHVFEFGHRGDVPVVGDWTGSGVKTIGVFRDGVWFLDSNGDGKLGADDMVVRFGEPGDMPVVGDWNGTGMDSIGVYRQGKWILDSNHNFKEDAKDEVRQLGEAGDTPVVGDWTGSGKTEIGVFHNGAIERPDVN